MRAADFRTLLAKYFTDAKALSPLLLALADRAACLDEMIERARSAFSASSDQMLWFGSFGRKPFDDVLILWQALLLQDAEAIERLVREMAPQRRGESESIRLESAFGSMIDPLILLNRADVLRRLHDNLLNGSSQAKPISISEDAALALAKVDDWDRAIAVLDRAFANGANPHINMVHEGLLWKFAYLYRQTDRALPRLARIPFHRQLAHMPEWRRWALAAQQIRSGDDAISVPVIEPDRQPFGYTDAAAMKIAALERRGLQDEARRLRAILRPRRTSMTFVDQYMTLDISDQDNVVEAAGKLIARDKRYDEATRFSDARARMANLQHAADIIIDAFLDESDRRGAELIYRRHDPRRRPPPPGFDDASQLEHRITQETLANCAARSGEFFAARGHAIEYREALLIDDNIEQEEKAADVFGLWPLTIVAGVEEGHLPKQALCLLTATFRSAY